MHRFWDTILRPAFLLLEPKSIIEIGCGEGLHTEKILGYCREHKATLHVIDTRPRPARLGGDPLLRYHQGKSLEVLPQIGAADAVLIDGDHNWHTVLHELRTIDAEARKAGKPFPAVFLHDMGWPYGRRDMYYDPSAIPEHARQPHRLGGLMPGQCDVQPHGANAHFHHAIAEGGAQNGVRTAAEEFAQDRSDLRLLFIPGLFGLGILIRRSLLTELPALETLLDASQSPLLPHLEATEEDRLQAFAAMDQAAQKMAGPAESSELPPKSKWGAPVRFFRALIRTSRDGGVSVFLRDSALQLWEQSGIPLLEPEWLRAIRLRDRSAPVHGEPRKASAEDSGETAAIAKDASLPAMTADVAVIIPCHNYGRYLGEAIESVLAQYVRPAEILVVDDASTDETAEVAARYADRGARYIRGEWRSVGAARNAGLAATDAEYLVFLDADNILHPDYLACGLRALAERRDTAVAYSSLECFGTERWTFRPEGEFDWQQFDTSNVIDAGALVRREALLQAGGWSHGIGQDGDWVTWRRVLSLGWKAVRSEGMFYYRKHEANMSLGLRDQPYVRRTGMIDEPVTFCLSLSGRSWAWPLMRAFLKRQTFPHSQVNLVILDTSQDEIFSQAVREWISSCDYRGVTHLCEAVGRKGLADENRAAAARPVSDACAAIYNRFARLVRTPLVFFIEDDVIPPDDVVERLSRSLDIRVVSVAGAYLHRQRPTPVAWGWSVERQPYDLAAGSGVQRVGGNGFGCLLLRGEYLRHTVFRSGPPYFNYDHHFYATAVLDEEREALIDWDCRCRHYSSANVWSEPS
jgi:hypothetical protein